MVRLPQSPRGREARTLHGLTDCGRSSRLNPQPPTGRAVPAVGTRWCQGKDAHPWRACCCSTALPRKFVAHRRRRAPTRTATASSGRRWASARTTRASCVLQCGKQARARPSGSLEACLQCHGAPQAARSSGQPRPISRSVLAISPDRACLRRRHLTCALTCGTCAKQRARGRRHECSDIGADAHVEGDVTAIMERLEQRTELGPEVLSTTTTLAWATATATATATASYSIMLPARARLSSQCTPQGPALPAS